MPGPLTRAQLEDEARNLIGYLEHKFGRGRAGITLFVFELNSPEPGTNIAYISNADRADMIASLKEWLARMESGMSTDPPGPSPKA